MTVHIERLMDISARVDLSEHVLAVVLRVASGLRDAPPRIRLLHWPSLLRSQLAARIIEDLRS